jgi:hypothetical protein
VSRIVPRLGIASDLRCNGGTLLAFLSGVGNGPHVFDDTKSYTGQESLHFTVPSNASGASYIAEGRIALVWFSDTDYDEWIIGPVTKTRGPGAVYDVVCRPITYKLTECGFVKTDIQSQNARPVFDDGIFQSSLTDLFQNKLIDNPNVSTLLPWLGLGTITPTATIDLDWSNATPQALILSAVDAVQAVAGVPYDYRLVRNGTTSYDITVTAS